MSDNDNGPVVLPGLPAPDGMEWHPATHQQWRNAALGHNAYLSQGVGRTNGYFVARPMPWKPSDAAVEAARDAWVTSTCVLTLDSARAALIAAHNAEASS